MASSDRTIEEPTSDVEIGTSIVVGAEGSPSILANSLKSNCWTEGVLSGAEGSGIGSVCLSGS